MPAPSLAARRLESRRREREVADQVASGKANREVAVALILSVKTIESRLARIYEKFGVHSRAALATLIGREAGARGISETGLDPRSGVLGH